MEPWVLYEDIPEEMRVKLDEVYAPRGVMSWWNVRHGWLDGFRAREEWKTEEGRARVREIVDIVTGGGW